MIRRIRGLVYLIYSIIQKRQAVRERFLSAQVAIAMSRGKVTSYKLSPEERRGLLAIGAQIGHDVKDILHIVTWQTYLRWLREAGQGQEPGRVGRKRSIAPEIRALVVRIAKENLQWGKRRIVGELAKLGIRIATRTVKTILAENDIPSPPGKRISPPVPWWTLVKAHLDCVVATDFFCKPFWTWRGRMNAYCLFFIHLGTRKVYCSPATFNPDEEWVMHPKAMDGRRKRKPEGREAGCEAQQARNAAMWLEDEKLSMRFLIHDRDTKYTAQFRRFFKDLVKDQKGSLLRTPIKRPELNRRPWMAEGSCRRQPGGRDAGCGARPEPTDGRRTLL